MGVIIAPFTAEEVEGLNAWQAAGHVHPFTCGNEHSAHVSLIATTEGWHCPMMHCTYTQDWAHDFMAEGPPANPLDIPARPAPQPKRQHRVLIKLPIAVAALPYITGSLPDNAVVLTDDPDAAEFLVIEFDEDERSKDA